MKMKNKKMKDEHEKWKRNKMKNKEWKMKYEINKLK